MPVKLKKASPIATLQRELGDVQGAESMHLKRPSRPAAVMCRPKLHCRFQRATNRNENRELRKQSDFHHEAHEEHEGG